MRQADNAFDRLLHELVRGDAIEPCDEAGAAGIATAAWVVQARIIGRACPVSLLTRCHIDRDYLSRFID